MIEKQQLKISEKLVERSEFTRLELAIKKWTKDGFADREATERNSLIKILKTALKSKKNYGKILNSRQTNQILQELKLISRGSPFTMITTNCMRR